MSPDWSSKPDAAPYADLTNPQSLNLYSYVFNNPLSLTDPRGHACDDSDSMLESDAMSTDKGGGMIETVRVNGRCDPFADLATIAMSPAQEVTPQQTQSIPLAPINPARPQIERSRFCNARRRLPISSASPGYLELTKRLIQWVPPLAMRFSETLSPEFQTQSPISPPVNLERPTGTFLWAGRLRVYPLERFLLLRVLPVSQRKLESMLLRSQERFSPSLVQRQN